MSGREQSAGYVRKAVVIGLGLFTLGVLTTTMAQAVRPPLPGAQCLHNNECTYPLVCDGRYCKVQCMTSRDCTGGWICVQGDTPPKTSGPAVGTVVKLENKICVDPAVFPIQRPTLEANVNYPGNDIGGIGYPLPVASAAACDQMCLETPGCKAWTYVKPNVQSVLPRCYVKSAAGPAMQDPNTISGKR